MLFVASVVLHAKGGIVSQKALDISSASVEIVLPKGATESEREASVILRDELDNIQAYAGIGAVNKKNICIYFVNTSKLDEDLPIECLINENNFAINIGKTAITLEYPSSDKSYWIVGKFLREFCKAEYFSPMPWGADYTDCSLRFKVGRHEFSPDYVASQFFDYRLSIRWRALNGIDVSSKFFNFSHNLSRIFTRELFEKEPEYFSIRRNDYGKLERMFWGQPDILNYRTQHYVADKALEVLQKQKMFSLGINDSSYVDESAEYRKYKRGYFRGFPDWSNSVFEFSNLVANRVCKTKPNAILGALAYFICENPPDFKIHKNIVPFYTTDRANYADKAYADADFEMLSKWGNSGCATFGIYEYMYGAPYLFARDISKFSTMAIARAYECGARFYFAETLSLWGYDACKMWLVARFIEDTTEDFEKLQDFFFEKYYKDCADDMRKFFKLSRSVWMQRKEPTYWLAFYKSENSLEKLNELLLSQMADALSNAKAKAKFSSDKNVSMRVEETSKLFNMTVSAYRFYISKLEFIDLLSSRVSTDKLLQAFRKYETLKQIFFDAFEQNCKMYYSLARFRNLYEQEKFLPFDAFIFELNKRGAFANSNDEILKKLSQTSEFKAISSLSENVAFSYGISKWEDYRRSFGVVERDFDGAKIQPDCDAKGALFRFENCELTGISRYFSASENDAVAFSGLADNRASIGTLTYAGLLFLDKSKNVIKRKTFVFPNRTDINFMLADICPKGTTTVAISIFATKQKKGDVFLLRNIVFERQ